MGPKTAPHHRQTSTHLGWLCSRYASKITGINHFHSYLLQVLACENPFCDVPRSLIASSILRQKRRLKKPENAPTIGFSDSLWDFTQRCWHEEPESRPEVKEVAKHLGTEASSWGSDMLPCGKIKAAVPATPAAPSGSFEDPDSDTFGEFEI